MTKRAKIAVGVLLAALIGTAVGLGVPLAMEKRAGAKATDRLSAVYEKSYAEASDSLRNVETKLAKINVVTGAAVRRELLADVWKACDVAVTNLTQLGEENADAEAVVKFLNQVGDYSYYLMGKVSAGEGLTQAEKENIRSFRALVARLRADLAAAGDDRTDGDRISAATLADLSAVGGAIKSYSSIDYPELIYDGPFSDGLNDRVAKFPQGKAEIDEAEALRKVRSLWENVGDAKVIGTGESSIPCYVAECAVGETRYCVFVTKAGGYVAAINAYAATDDPTLTEEECVEKARAFLEKIGYADMAPVWVYDNDSTVYVNFAYRENDVVFYPDLIKVKVSLNDGTILGLEATNYLYNHGAREIDYDGGAESAIRPEEELSVTGTRYCVIPTDWNEEVYCKEYVGTYDGMTYYLYFDLATGEEIRALVVVDESGNKLM